MVRLALADPRDVCFISNSGICSVSMQCPLWAKSGHFRHNASRIRAAPADELQLKLCTPASQQQGPQRRTRANG
jgi:hypothetical protein